MKEYVESWLGALSCYLFLRTVIKEKCSSVSHFAIIYIGNYFFYLVTPCVYLSL